MTLLPLLSDALLLAATLGLAVYCWRLSRRLRAFDAADSGAGDALARMSEQVDQLQAALKRAADTNTDHLRALDHARERAEDSIGQLDMLIAAAEDVAAAVPSVEEAEPAPPDVPVPGFRFGRPGTGAAQ